ncbi:MAG: hypothetical protein CL843_01935 [Crocinitomicaceae bacterium]|nr:hypothetical protein [Crocinitomicaceae bacterium]
MDNNFSNIKERILYIAKIKGIPLEEFTQSIGMTYGNFKGANKERPINSTALENILSTYDDVDSHWLITGEGAPLKAMKVEGNNEDLPLPENNESNERLIPLLPIDALAGFGGGDWSISNYDIQESYVVPDFNGIDFMIRVKGSSMYPKYASGDIVACRKMNDDSFIQWNKVYVISTRDQGILVKRLKKSEVEDHYMVVSDNENYDPFDIPKDQITGLALVVGVIRLE